MAAAPVRELGVEPAGERRRRLCIDLLERMLAEAKQGQGFETVFFLGTYPNTTRFRDAWTSG